ncbi:MAG: hypothetical protein KGI91_07045 [Burkholderiales bacterium]|nr:hypothetical protein [Burkholderiales bacterium]
MSRLTAEWQRLFQLSPDNAALMSPEGHGRALVIEFTGPDAWPACSAIWDRAQTEFGWPAPAIAVNGRNGYQLWMSLKRPTPAALAHAWVRRLAALAQGLIEARCIQIHPSSPEPTAHVPDWIQAIPRQQGEQDQWSAFVTRDLTPVFEDSPWLDIPPSPDGQADLLAALQSIDTLAVPEADEAPVFKPDQQPSPRQFLLQVMHDPSAPLALRIEAAKALLPYSP